MILMLNRFWQFPVLPVLEILNGTTFDVEKIHLNIESTIRKIYEIIKNDSVLIMITNNYEGMCMVYHGK